MRKRLWRQKLLDGFTYFATFLSVFALGTIFFFAIREGAHLLSFDLLRGNYHAQGFVATLQEEPTQTFELSDHVGEGKFAVERFGLVLEQTFDLAGDGVIKVAYIDEASPLKSLLNSDPTSETRIIGVEVGTVMRRVSYEAHPTSLTSRGAESMARDMNDPDRTVREVIFSFEGGGIRGSLITTLYLIFLTLIIALPFGVLTAIYFNEFAPNNRLTKGMRNFIETLTGVPSIIYGLLGITVFVPLTVRLTPASNTNLIAGALTLGVILLPVIIRTTEEALKVVPNDHRFASLALGANKTQTTFKVVLPQALPGILTATFLGIGRVIGESAALIFVLGTAIRDSVRVLEPSTSLAVHIWSMMTDEPANIALSSTIALIILLVVLILNLAIKTTVWAFEWKGRR